MSSGFVMSLIILAVAIASLAFIIQAEGGVGEIPRLMKRVGLPTDWLERSPVPAASPRRTTPAPVSVQPSPGGLDLTSGSSRFSQGSCSNDSDCQVSGCSSEVCGSEPTISTCEYSDSFPSTKTHTCGCVNKHCGWTAK